MGRYTVLADLLHLVLVFLFLLGLHWSKLTVNEIQKNGSSLVVLPVFLFLLFDLFFLLLSFLDWDNVQGHPRAI